jgi:hypothetical protein
MSASLLLVEKPKYSTPDKIFRVAQAVVEELETLSGDAMIKQQARHGLRSYLLWLRNKLQKLPEVSRVPLRPKSFMRLGAQEESHRGKHRPLIPIEEEKEALTPNKWRCMIRFCWKTETRVEQRRWKEPRGIAMLGMVMLEMVKPGKTIT